jgi:hypothetical protein
VLLVSLGLDAGFPAADGYDSVDESLIFLLSSLFFWYSFLYIPDCMKFHAFGTGRFFSQDYNSRHFFVWWI